MTHLQKAPRKPLFTDETESKIFLYKYSCYKKTKQVIGNIHDNPELLKGAEQ